MAEQAESVESRIVEMLRVEEEGEAPPEPEGQPKSEPEAIEQPDERQEEDSPTEDQKAEKSEEEAIEEVEVSSLNDLAEHLGVDVADLYSVPIPVNTPDGKKEVTLGEWKDSYQETAQLKAERAKLAEQVGAREEAIKQFNEGVQHQLAQANALVQHAESELVRDYQSIDWDSLRSSDPAEFAAKQQEFGQRQYQIEQVKQSAQAQLQQAHSQHQKMLQESLPDQRKKLSELIPAWADEGTASAEKAKVADFLVKQGFKQDEVSSLYDARAVALAYKAMKYDELQSSEKPATKKRLKIGGKPIKPGKSQSKAEQRASVSKDQRVKFKKTGNVKDLAALLNTDEFLGDM